MARQAKLKPSDALPVLLRLGVDEQRAVYLRPKVSEEAIHQMQATAKRDLGEPVPNSYIAFLRVSNGIQINGAYFKEAENLVSENLDGPYSEVIVLGNEGNMVEYVFDKLDRRFHTINMGFPDERFDSFDSFEEMLLGVMMEQQVL